MKKERERRSSERAVEYLKSQNHQVCNINDMKQNFAAKTHIF